MEAPGDAAPAEHAGTNSRFVLVCAPDPEGRVAPPEALRRALDTRDARITVQTSVYDAMADLVEHEHAVSLRQAEPLILLIVEPDRVAHAHDLVEAAARYAPHAACWRFCEHDEPQLRAFDRPPTAETAAPVTVRPDVADSISPRPVLGGTGGGGGKGGGGEPNLRLAGDSDLPPQPQDEDDPDCQGPVLSQEELDMLLSDEWERQTGEGGPS